MGFDRIGTTEYVQKVTVFIRECGCVLQILPKPILGYYPSIGKDWSDDDKEPITRGGKQTI